MYKVFVKGFVGNIATKILIEKKEKELTDFFNKSFLTNSKNKIDETLKGGDNPSLTIYNKKIFDMEEISRGGVLTALWKICDRNKFGLKYSMRKIPILQATIEISNYFDLNPYRLLTYNSVVVISDSDDLGIDFKEIGEITNEKKRVRTDGETEAFLTKDYKDEIDKVLSRFSKR